MTRRARRVPDAPARASRRALDASAATAAELSPCPLCGRPNHHPSDHHLVPKSRGGTETQTVCRDCHKAIHATISNKDLERTYHTREALLGHGELAAMVAFIARQDPGGVVRVRRTRSRRGKKP